MDIIIKATVGLAGLAFVLAVVSAVVFAGKFLGVSPEAYSRACSNLALIAIGLAVGFKERSLTT
ncbi:MAG: hypothetical protein JRH16_03760 [Deltaproteobacteria bacterium]|nr:hypothetical protein [Deltaproteobacteria bacterium]MBW2361101.1 hypothetical protein [Deltaproteobacteria bacterium]